MDGGKHDAQRWKKNHFSLPSPENDPVQDPPSTLQLTAFAKSVEGVQAILDEFLRLERQVLQTVPNVLYVRVIYALAVLLKIAFNVTSRGLGEFIDPAGLKLEFYLETMVQRLTEAAGSKRFRVPAHWLPVVLKIKEWYDQHQRPQKGAMSGRGSRDFKPFTHNRVVDILPSEYTSQSTDGEATDSSQGNTKRHSLSHASPVVAGENAEWQSSQDKPFTDIQSDTPIPFSFASQGTFSPMSDFHINFGFGSSDLSQLLAGSLEDWPMDGFADPPMLEGQGFHSGDN
jgi:hypothetical protein